MNTLTYKPATEIVRLIACGDVSAFEVVRAHLEQIERLNPTLNAFVELRGERALAEASAQDAAAAAGQGRGPLGGLPISIKSAIEVDGLKVETGSPSRKGIVAARDAVCVARLRAAGAIVLGATNVADMLMGYESENPIYGRTNNPWDPDRTPGGSSGGESAAIAACCSAGGIGSDGGGSVRLPAHFTGICALKPTPGRIPGTGHQPPCLGPFSLLGVVGPMARTIADVYAMFAVVAGWDDADPMAVRMPIAPLDAEPHERIHIGFFEDDGRTPVTIETRAAVRAAAEAAARAGFDVEGFRPTGLDRARELWDTFFCEIGLMVLKEPLKGAEMDLAILKAFLERGARPPLTSLGLSQAWADRDVVRADVVAQMNRHRVLICPVASIPAFRHGERRWSVEGHDVGYLDAMTYTQWLNILGNPAAVVPVGTSPEGLPIAVQVVGRPFEEEIVLAVAAAIERECGGYRKPPIS
ncbi:MAG TPA: amidase [Vicinamibacterales bacterium]|jgi:Asp-tRNA(Asn)/Glu-tRNA(Gln) amidotransferase A subunit family amidase|nr:amidase [Vicinamibacterales bacterium]